MSCHGVSTWLWSSLCQGEGHQQATWGSQGWEHVLVNHGGLRTGLESGRAEEEKAWDTGVAVTAGRALVTEGTRPQGHRDVVSMLPLLVYTVSVSPGGEVRSESTRPRGGPGV